MDDPFHQRVLARTFEKLAEAVGAPTHPWRTAVVATAGPAARILVLRGVDSVAGTLDFHTDARSAKIGQLADDPRAEWVFWEPRVKEQVRIATRAAVHRDDAIAEAAWAALPPHAWREYASVAPPGHAVDDLATAQAREAVQAAARASFCVVRCTIERIDWMQVGPAAEHKRIRFEPGPGGFSARWLVP
ncbi:MAG: pyridoxamine 5'-phosphate oxidase family protein [bacterium]